MFYRIMRLLLLTLFSMYQSFSCFSQIENDSLLGIWVNQSYSDSARVSAINQLCSSSYIYNHPDSAFYYSELALELAVANGLKKEMALALFTLGKVSSNMSNYDKAIDFQQRSIQVKETLDDQIGIAKSLTSIGNVYLMKSEYSNAIENYMRSLEIYEGENNLEGISKIQNNIGLVFFDMKDYENALQYLNKALSIKKENEYEGQANTLINIGTVYRLQKDYSKALKFYNEALDFKLKNKTKKGLATCYSNIALIHQAQNENEKALNFFRKSMQLHLKTGNQKGIARGLIYFGKMHFPSNLDSVIIYSSKALKLATENQNKEEIADAAELLYNSYQEKGDYKLALENQNIFRETRDEMFSLENQKAVINSQFNQKVADKVIENQDDFGKKLNCNRNQIWFERLVFLALLTLCYFGAKKFVKTKIEERQEEHQKLHDKIERLKEKLATQSISSTQKREELTLDKAKIEQKINTKLGESSWMILNIIFKNPSISNKEIAKEVSLSLEGVSSSLRRMYVAFGIKSSSNKKITLIMEAVRISTEA